MIPQLADDICVPNGPSPVAAAASSHLLLLLLMLMMMMRSMLEADPVNPVHLLATHVNRELLLLFIIIVVLLLLLLVLLVNLLLVRLCNSLKSDFVLQKDKVVVLGICLLLNCCGGCFCKDLLVVCPLHLLICLLLLQLRSRRDSSSSRRHHVFLIILRLQNILCGIYSKVLRDDPRGNGGCWLPATLNN